MSIFDWNKNGKIDSSDRYLEYKIYEACTKYNNDDEHYNYDDEDYNYDEDLVEYDELLDLMDEE